MQNSYTVVLVRHGHTQWNLNNLFTGWSEIPLSKAGLEEAKLAGRLLAKRKLHFDEAHVSALDRTRQALDVMLQAANHPPIPVCSSWRLNERHYGALQGMNKEEIFSTFGYEQSFSWWRGYDASPPPMSRDDPRHPSFSSLYQDVDPALLPDSESLAQCQQRFIPYWNQTLAPAIQSGKRLIVVSHGNTLRGLRMHVERIDPIEIQSVEIPPGIPFIYRLNRQMSFEEIEWLSLGQTQHDVVDLELDETPEP